MLSICQDNGATRDGSTKETIDLKILLIFCGLKKLTKLVEFPELIPELREGGWIDLLSHFFACT
jgi:hypothetical protein